MEEPKYYEQREEEPAFNAEDLWQIVCRRRWWILGSVFACWALAWAASWALPPQYRSESLILVEQQKIPQEYVTPNVTTDLQQRLKTMTQQILSRTRLERIVKDFGLYADGRSRFLNKEPLERMRQDIQIEVVETPGSKELSAFRIYYLARTPELAQKVASQLSSLFIEENLLAERQQSEHTTEFLSSEVDRARNSLAKQEIKVKEYKARYLGQLPSQLQGNMGVLVGLQNRYETLAASLSHSQQQKLYLESLLHQYRAIGVPSAEAPQGTTAADQELIRLRDQLADIQSRYTDRHPDIVRLKRQIAEAEERKRQLEVRDSQRKPDAAKVGTTLASMQAMSPVMQLESQLTANEQEIKDTKSQMDAAELQIQNYQGRLNAAPVREQQMADLTRDYDRSKENYESLLKKQMQSELATNLERQQGGRQFRILDPPSLPQKAFWPNRVKFSLGGLAGGLMLGLALAFALEKTVTYIYTNKDVQDIIPAKVPDGVGIISGRMLVAIPHNPVPGEERRRARLRRFEWAAAAVLLTTIAAGNVVSFFKG